MSSLTTKIKESASYLRDRFKGKVPRIGIILGSGMGDIAKDLNCLGFILYRDIPNFPIPTVPGHEGKLWLGERKNGFFVVLQGRLHFHEGYSMSEVTFPVRVLAYWGVKLLIITASAGGISEDLGPGSLILVKDHINLIGENPLRGLNEPELGERFLDLSEVYDSKIRKLLVDKFDLREGVYAGVIGPTYETPAEIRALKILGADAVGMSVIPEAIVAKQMGLKVLGLVGITNRAASGAEKVISHEMILKEASRFRDSLREIISFCLEELEIDSL